MRAPPQRQNLQRWKPSPVPPIDPVPEYRADARLGAVYAETRTALQVPWMGVVAMALARYPAFYAALWGGLRTLVQSAEFVSACAALRAEADAAAESLGATALAGPLRALGYAERELDEIRERIAVFSHGNMPYLLIATTARLLLEGRALSDARRTTPFDGRHGPSPTGGLTLIEPHHADAPTRALYAEIMTTLDLPFVNTDYRALARWPSYFALAWGDLAPRVATPAYETAAERVHAAAVDLALGLPNPGGLTPETLAAAAARDGEPAEIADVVRLFQWLLPGLATNVAAFRRQLA